MEIKAFYPNPDDIPVTLTITMTAGEWKKIDKLIEPGPNDTYNHQAYNMSKFIHNATWKLSQYTQPDTQDA